jgi:anthranilate synthase component I
VVWARLAADLDTPVSLMLKLVGNRKDSFMLESVTGGEVRGRYSIVGMKPDLIWRCHGTQRDQPPRPLRRRGWEAQPGDPLTLRALLAESRIAMPADLPPIAAGLFGYLGYDMIRLVEHLPRQPRPAGPARRGAAAPLGRGGAGRGQGRGDGGRARLGRPRASARAPPMRRPPSG